MMDNCIFCKIVSGEIPKEFDFESEALVVFPDINPSADVHLLIVPKEHIESMKHLNKNHGKLLTKIYDTINKLVAEKNLEDGFYRVVVNGGKAQHIPHLHFHLLGGNWKKMV